jgi:predicted amidohydrolase YtcJ
MSRIIPAVLCGLLVSTWGSVLADGAGGGAAAVVLIANARIYTADSDGSVLEPGAMAIGGSGEILAIGKQAGLQDGFGQAAAATVIDMGGRAVLPGLIDSHGHLHGLALAFTRADLVGTASKAEILARLQDFAADLPADSWLLGRGWDQNDWPEAEMPDRGDLDAAFPDRPVWLGRIDGHAGWANSRALAAADRDLAGDWQPDGGRIHRDGQGRPTGILVDHAMTLIDSIVPPVPEDLLDAALDTALHRLLSLGLTGVHDPGIDREILALYQRKLAIGKLPLRVYAMADGIGETLDWLCTRGAFVDPSQRLIMRAVKLYADGALGSRGAALLADYSDEPGNRGLLFRDDGQMEGDLRRVLSCGLQAAVHAIGDAANRQVLDAFERVLPDFPDNPGRHRIEHAQILHPDDIPRFAGLGIIAAMQPTHATSDMYWAEDRLGAGRLAGAYAWNSLRARAARLAFGSDFPVEKVDPMLGIHAAVTRQDLAGWPDGGWRPGERLSREQALRAFTIDAAWAAFMDDMVGSLEVGKQADFIVLDRDVMRVPADQIPQVRVEQTWVGGQRVYGRADTGR